MRRDKRPVKEQVHSGFLIAGKLVAAFCVAAAFFSGCALVQEAASSSEIVVGWLLITLSIVVMASTVRFWAAGFVGFIAYAALRLLIAILFASSLHVSPLHIGSVAASLFVMSILCIRFASGRPRITQVDRASLVLAAICALLSVPLMDSYRSVAVLSVGNVALALSWLAARASRQARQSVQNTAANE
ncbi:MAG: hypothetical protein ABR921_20245 [Candidatus Sulfotelmatobacter sp.]